MTGFEPATSSSRTKRATGLRYIPIREKRVGMTGFEPATPTSLTWCANRTALHPELKERCKVITFFCFGKPKPRFIRIIFFWGARAPAFGAPPAGGSPRRMAGRWNGIYRCPAPAASPRGRGVSLIYNRLRPAIRPARRCAPRRRHGLRFARWNGLASGRASRVARRAVRLNSPRAAAVC